MKISAAEIEKEKYLKLGRHLLDQAAMTGSINVARMEELIAEGADVDIQDNDGSTCLHLLARSEARGAATACTMLFKHGAKMYICDNKGRTPDDDWVNDRIRNLFSHRLQVVADNSEKLARLLNDKFTPTSDILDVIGQGIDIHYGDYNNRNMGFLALAARNENMTVCKVLVKLGCDPQHSDYDYLTASQRAPEGSVLRGYLESAERKYKSSWIVFDTDSVAYVSSNANLGIKLCSIFNMVAREKTVVSQPSNSAQPLYHSQPQSFDDLPEDQVNTAIKMALDFDIAFDETKARGSQLPKKIQRDSFGNK